MKHGRFIRGAAILLAAIPLVSQAQFGLPPGAIGDVDIIDSDFGGVCENPNGSKTASGSVRLAVHGGPQTYHAGSQRGPFAMYHFYVTVSYSGEFSGRGSATVQGNRSEWSGTIGGQGGGGVVATLDFTLVRETRRFRQSQHVGGARLSLTANFSDSGTARYACSDPAVTVNFSDPVMQTTLSQVSARYTGPFSRFPRIRARIESMIRSQIRSQFESQVRTKTPEFVAKYKAERNRLIQEALAGLPAGCQDCSPSVGLVSGGDAPPTPPRILDCNSDFMLIHRDPTLSGICKNSSSGFCYAYGNGAVNYERGAVPCPTEP